MALKKTLIALLMLLLCKILSINANETKWSSFINSAAKMWPTDALTMIIGMEKNSSVDELIAVVLNISTKFDKTIRFEISNEYCKYENVLKGARIVVLEDNLEKLKMAAQNGEMRKGIWLMPFGIIEPNEIKSRFDSQIFMYSFTTNLSAVIWEVFSVKNVNKFFSEAGNWSNELGFMMKAPNKWTRRQTHLKGIKLRAVQIHWPPFTYLKATENGTVTKSWGILPEAYQNIQVNNNDMACTCTVYTRRVLLGIRKKMHHVS